MQIKTKFNFGEKILFPYWGSMEKATIGGVKIKHFPHGKKPKIEYLCNQDICYGQWREEEAIKLDTGK